MSSDDVGSQSTMNLGKRIGARAIDMILLTAIEVGVGQFTGFGFDWLIGGSLFVILYFVACDVLFGTTVGKRVLGLRVHAVDGAKLTWSAAFKRELFILVGSVPLVGPLIAIGLWVWFGIRIKKTGNGPHDDWAKSRVTMAATR